jgi:hypothetical protein
VGDVHDTPLKLPWGTVEGIGMVLVVSIEPFHVPARMSPETTAQNVGPMHEIPPAKYVCGTVNGARVLACQPVASGNSPKTSLL